MSTQTPLFSFLSFYFYLTQPSTLFLHTHLSFKQHLIFFQFNTTLFHFQNPFTNPHIPNTYLSHSILKQIITLTLTNNSTTHTSQSLFFLSSLHLTPSFCFLLFPQFIFIYNIYLIFLYHSSLLHSIVSLLFTQPHMYISLIT